MEASVLREKNIDLSSVNYGNQLVNWKVIPCKYFAKLGKKWLVFSQNLDNITFNKYAKHIPEFYGEVLRSWNKIGGGQTRTPLNFADVRK